MTPEWLSALTALAAVVLGPFISFCITKLQIRLSAISSSRKEWTKQLRDLVGDLIGEYRFLDYDSKIGEPVVIDKTLLQQLYRVETQLKLMLNPKEAEHQELIRVVSNAVTYAGSTEKNKANKITKHVQAIEQVAASILKTEEVGGNRGHGKWEIGVRSCIATSGLIPQLSCMTP